MLKARFPLLTTLREFDLAHDQALAFFVKLITPILSYGSEIWASCTQQHLKVMSHDSSRFVEYAVENELKRVHLRFCKNVLGVKRNTPHLATMGDFRIFPVTLSLISRMITYWYRLATLDDNSLLQKACNEILTIPDELSDWRNTIKYTLKLLGLESLFDCPSSLVPLRLKEKLKTNCDPFSFFNGKDK